MTRRQREYLEHVLTGAGRRKISELMGINNKTIDTHRWSAYHKLGIATDLELLKLAIEQGWCHVAPLADRNPGIYPGYLDIDDDGPPNESRGQRDFDLETPHPARRGAS